MSRRPDERRREQLLDEIEALILREGFRDLRVGELAKRLRCSRSTLYKLADTKDELIRMVVWRFVNRAIDEAQAHGDREDRAELRITSFLEVISVWQGEGSLDFWRDVRDFDVTRGVLDYASARAPRVLKGYMDAGVEAGELRPVNTEFLALVIWLAGRSTRDPDILESVGLDPASGVEEFSRFLVRGLRA